MTNDALAVSWEVHRRTRSICREIGIQLHELAIGRSGLIRYVEASIKTIRLLLTERPRVLLVQNPSIVLALIAVLYKTARPSSRTVVDAHNVAVEQLESSTNLLRLAARAVMNAADWTIVTNEALAQKVRVAGGRPIVLIDPLPVLPTFITRRNESALPTVAVIATYAADEPIEEIILAAGRLMGTAQFCFTGRSQSWLRGKNVAAPPNVTFTGFLSDVDYWGLLDSSRVIVDLTTRDDCLVCGAYEAVAAGRPVVLSDSSVNRETFGDAAIYSCTTASEIESAVREALAVADEIIFRADEARKRLRDTWNGQSAVLRSALSFGR